VLLRNHIDRRRIQRAGFFCLEECSVEFEREPCQRPILHHLQTAEFERIHVYGIHAWDGCDRRAVATLGKLLDGSGGLPPERANIEIHRIDPQAEARQITRLRATRARRNNTDVERLLDRLAVEAGTSSTNLLPVTVELVKARASMGEIVQRLRAVYGSYVETPVF